jgi:hypothetical protein
MTGQERRRVVPAERFTAEVPLMDGTSDVWIRSYEGFRYADIVGGEDRRWLGVRVRVF